MTTTGRVVLLLIPDEDFAWEVFNVASEQEDVARAVMVNADHPGITELITDPMRTDVSA